MATVPTPRERSGFRPQCTPQLRPDRLHQERQDPAASLDVHDPGGRGPDDATPGRLGPQADRGEGGVIDEDLPLDFNTLMSPAQKIHYGKLSWALVRSPWKLAELLAFQQKTIDAAQSLGAFLTKLIASL